MSGHSDSTPQVLVVGVGQMGSAMAQRCMDAGFTTHVIDIQPSLRVEFQENWLYPEFLSTLSAINNIVILVCVVDAYQAEEVLFLSTDQIDRHHHGLAYRVGAPSVFVLTSTMGVSEVQRIGGRLRTMGHACIDAPVSGGPLRARDGTMSMMLAGDSMALRSAEVVLNALSEKQTCVGSALGTATRVKLLNNALAAAHLYAHAQVLAAAGALDVSAKLLQKVIDESSGQSWIGAHRGQRHLAGDTSVHARMALLAKDSQLALSLLKAEGLECDWLLPAAAAFAQACALGWQDLDDSEMHHFVVQNHTRKTDSETR